MALAQNGVCNALGGSNTAVSSVGPLTHAVGGTSQTGTALMMVVIGLVMPTTTVQTVSTVTDSNGNTWQRLYQTFDNSGWNAANMNNGQRAVTLECWYTKNATIGTSINISATFSGSVNAVSVVASAKFTGYDSVQPFDQNGSMPAVQRNHTGAATRVTPSISTTNAHILPFSIWCAVGGSFTSSNVSFNGVLRNDNAIQQENGTLEFVKVDFQCGVATTGPYSGVTYTGSSNYDNGYFVGFALTSDASTPSGTLVTTETADTAHMVGYLFAGVKGDLTATENPDTLAATGYVAAVVAANMVETQDIFSAFGSQPITGTFVTTGAADQFHATGIGRGEDGVLITVGTPDIFSAVGVVPPRGTLAATGAADRARFIGAGVTQVRRRRRRFVT